MSVATHTLVPILRIDGMDYRLVLTKNPAVLVILKPDGTRYQLRRTAQKTIECNCPGGQAGYRCKHHRAALRLAQILGAFLTSKTDMDEVLPKGS